MMMGATHMVLLMLAVAIGRGPPSAEAVRYWKAFTCYPQRNKTTGHQSIHTQLGDAVFAAPHIGRAGNKVVGGAAPRCPIAGPGTGVECITPAAEVAATVGNVKTGGHALFAGWQGNAYLEKEPCKYGTESAACAYWLDGDAANSTGYPGVWFDAWQATLAARHTVWFQQLKAAGGLVDVLMLDFESVQAHLGRLSAVAPSVFSGFQ
jgi:hypothetical protein